MGKDLKEFLEEKDKKLKNLISEVINLETFLERYPDTKVDRDRWDNERYYSPAINAEVNDVEIHHTCGCCEDAPLVARPFKKIKELGIRLYSDPCRFFVGEKNAYGYGEREDKGWEEEMRREGIPKTIIRKIKKYFKENPAGHFSDDDTPF